MNEVIPITNEEGKKLTPYTFTIENVCSNYTKYYINLETLSGSDKILPDIYVKANLVTKEDEKDVFLDTLTTGYVNAEKAIEDAQSAYMLYDGELAPNEKKQFSLRVWMDEATPALDEVMNATWQGKITVIASYVPLESKRNIMVSMNAYEGEIECGMTRCSYPLYNLTYTQNGKYENKLTTIEFQNTINPYAEAEEIVDFSLLQDKSVLGYYVKNEDNTTYNLYIQADGKIKVNTVAKYYFATGGNTEFIGMENLDTSEVRDMSYMFSHYTGTVLELSWLDTKNATNMNNMFWVCENLESLNASNFDTRNVTDMSSMFSGCENLTSLDLSNFNTSKVTDMNYMFNWCKKLASLDISNFDTSKVTDMHRMFYYCFDLTALDISSFDTSKVTDMQYMFDSCARLTNLDLSNFNTSKVTNMEHMFYHCSKLDTLNISSFDTSQVTGMMKMFSGCSTLTSLDLSSFNTSSVTNMAYMLDGCSSLTNLNLSSFNTSSVTTMAYMFNGCSSLTSLDLSSFNTSSVTNVGCMFQNCSSLTSLDVSSFNTSKVTDMWYMFSGCSTLTNIIYGAKFIHANGANISNMFTNCPANKPTDPSWDGVTF